MDRRLSMIVCGLLLAGCDPTDVRLTCEAGDQELSEALAARFDAPSACASDDECTLVTLDLQCPDDGARFEQCPYAVHMGDGAAHDAARTGALEQVCPRIPSDCVGGASCAETVARCVAARCVAIEASAACADRCAECLDDGSCEGHCEVHLDCLLAAEGCDAMRACVSGPSPDAG